MPYLIKILRAAVELKHTDGPAAGYTISLSVYILLTSCKECLITNVLSYVAAVMNATNAACHVP